MSKSKVRITAIDIILIFAVIVIFAFAVVRNENVKSFNSQNSIEDSIITVSVKGVDRDNFSLFEKNDNVYYDNDDLHFRLGEISNIRSNPAIVITSDDDGNALAPDFSSLDITIDIKAECLVDEQGFYSINGKYLAPSYSFFADNGRIKFDCEVISVKTIN